MFRERGDSEITARTQEILNRSPYLRTFFSPNFASFSDFSIPNWKLQLLSTSLPFRQEIAAEYDSSYLSSYASDIYQFSHEGKQYVGHLPKASRLMTLEHILLVGYAVGTRDDVNYILDPLLQALYHTDSVAIDDTALDFVAAVVDAGVGLKRGGLEKIPFRYEINGNRPRKRQRKRVEARYDLYNELTQEGTVIFFYTPHVFDTGNLSRLEITENFFAPNEQTKALKRIIRTLRRNPGE